MPSPTYKARFGDDIAQLAKEVAAQSQMRLPDNGLVIPQICTAISLIEDAAIKEAVLKHFIDLGRVYCADEVSQICQRRPGENDELMAACFLMASHPYEHARQFYNALSEGGLKPGVYQGPAEDGVLISRGDHNGTFKDKYYARINTIGKRAVQLTGLMRCFRAQLIVDGADKALSTDDINTLMVPIRPFINAVREDTDGHDFTHLTLARMVLNHYDALEAACTKRLDKNAGNVLDMHFWRLRLAGQKSGQRLTL